MKFQNGWQKCNSKKYQYISKTILQVTHGIGVLSKFYIFQNSPLNSKKMYLSSVVTNKVHRVSRCLFISNNPEKKYFSLKVFDQLIPGIIFYENCYSNFQSFVQGGNKIELIGQKTRNNHVLIKKKGTWRPWSFPAKHRSFETANCGWYYLLKEHVLHFIRFFFFASRFFSFKENQKCWNTFIYESTNSILMYKNIN